MMLICLHQDAFFDILYIVFNRKNMRTTITLEPDVVKKIKEHTRDRQITPKTAINELIRQGFLAIQQNKGRPKKKLKIKTFDFGLRPELRNANFNHLAYMSDEEIEKEFFNQ